MDPAVITAIDFWVPAMSVELSVLQRLMLRLFGSVHVGDVQREGWRRSLPLYAFRCVRHGVVLNYAMGFDSLLLCPICLEEGNDGSPQ